MDKLIGRLFKLMDEWRHLPDYQLERRADLFFALYLPEVLKEVMGCEATKLIPEFPVRKGTVKSECSRRERNLSFKIDYLAIPKEGAPILVELKTDSGSRRSEQDDYLAEAAAKGIGPLLTGVFKLYLASKKRKKYFHLLCMLRKAGLVEFPGAPEGPHHKLPTRKDLALSRRVENLGDENLRIVYVQPVAKPKPKGKATVITFLKFKRAMHPRRDTLTRKFKESLMRWSKRRAGGTKPR